MKFGLGFVRILNREKLSYLNLFAKHRDQERGRCEGTEVRKSSSQLGSSQIKVSILYHIVIQLLSKKYRRTHLIFSHYYIITLHCLLRETEPFEPAGEAATNNEILTKDDDERY